MRYREKERCREERERERERERVGGGGERVGGGERGEQGVVGSYKREIEVSNYSL